MKIFDGIRLLLSWQKVDLPVEPNAWEAQIYEADRAPINPMKRPGPSVTPDNPILAGDPSPGFDKHSPTWKWIEQWSNQMIDTYRKQNDNISMDERNTAYIRGHIDMCKKIMALGVEEVKQDQVQSVFRNSPIHY
jgi:hypothetical protein